MNKGLKSYNGGWMLFSVEVLSVVLSVSCIVQLIN